MLRSLSRVVAMEPDRRRLALRCAFELLWASVQLAVVPRRAISPLLGEPCPPREVGDVAAAPAADVAVGLEVGRLVARVGAVLPWHPGCLRQVLATRRVLAARGVDAVIHLGVSDAATLGAHAWVSVGDVVVNGAGRRAAHTPVASYRG